MADSSYGKTMDGLRWWACPKDDVAEELEERARTLWDQDSARRSDIEVNLGRWGLTLTGLYLDNTRLAPESIRINLTKSLTETITAKIGKNRPRPLVLTDDGKWTLKDRAKKLQRFLDAVYGNTDVYALAPEVFRNAMLMGTGALYVCGRPHLARFEVENVFPIELLVDNANAARGPKYTREILRVVPRDKDELIELYPHAEDAIENAPVFGVSNEAPLGMMGGDLGPRAVRTAVVVEGWYRARYDAAGELIPGRYVCCINGETLVDEPYEDEALPFVLHHWSAPVRGFWGSPAVNEIRGMEREANVNLQRGQDAMRRSGMAIILSPERANVQAAKITNDPMCIVNYEGQIAPSVSLVPPAHPSLLEQPERLSRMAATQLGTNELQISAARPAGIESGRALEQLSEEHAVRFHTVSSNFERTMAKDLAVAFVRVARQMDKTLKEAGKGGLRLRSTYKREFIDLKWSQCDLGPNELFLDVFPVSVLPHLPAGRTAEVERWQANKWITDDQAKSLLDFPDLESVASVSRADFDLLEWQIGQMLDEGKDVVPSKRQNLEQARSYGTHALLRASRENYPESHIERLEDFLDVIDQWLNPPVETDPTAALGAPVGAPGLAGAPGAAPMGAAPPSPGLGATAPLADPGMLAGAMGGGMPPMM